MWAWSLDVTNLDRKINCVLLGLKWPEESVDILSVIRSKSTLRILNFEDSEIVVVLIQSLKRSCINLILKLGDT